MLETVYYDTVYKGYFAGQDDGIVTAGGKPARRQVVCLDAVTLQIVALCWSLDSGHYLVRGLDPARRYLLLAREYQRGYEPCAYDWLECATTLDSAGQAQLWQSWLT